ncbi:MAG TPA: S9 family peptidase [Gemmatimonadales bacterium]|nr:S9 family peptidase [Gemmatimonadales bacterium]
MLRRVACFLVITAGSLGTPLVAQRAGSDTSLLTVDRIFASPEFRSGTFGPLAWLADGISYTTLEQPASGRPGAGRDIVRYDAETGLRTILVPAARLIPAGDSTPLAIEDYSWSADGRKLLIFTNSQQVWRTNTRGDYWVLDLAGWTLKKLGGHGAASTLMFAKFSPDGKQVGWVRYGEYNLYVEDLAGGKLTQLTHDGSRTTINGTFDWVYEEELGLQDGWRWNPDGQSIAYWQLDATGVRDFLLYDVTDSLYAFINPVQYPKAGQTNSAGRVGVVSVAGGETKWINVPGDPRQNYIARMEWVPVKGAGSRELVIQHMNRLQDTLHVLIADAQTGAVRVAFTEADSAWVEHFDALQFLNGGKDILWMSERSGWSQIYLMPRSGGTPRAITSGNFDVLGVQRVDTIGKWVYYTASPDNPTQRYLYRVSYAKPAAPLRISPASEPGSHAYNISPSGRYAVHYYSKFGVPPVATLISLPDNRSLRTLIDNADLKAKVAALRTGAHEFRQIDIGNGIKLNAWFIKPVNFDSTAKYPVFFTVYGGPGSQTVLDSWGGPNYLWYQMLAERGYIVASVDNRGTGARGRAWRKIVYKQLGVIETQDQAAAARAVGRLPFVDSTRIGIWGWSYGGFMTLNTLTQAPDVYRMGIAVAPVTHWKYYDTIYTERYNALPQDNAAGYDKGSPLTYAKNLKAKLLIVHGTGDDNVHFQNTQAMVNALVAANRPFSLMIYPNRNHGIYGGNTRQHLYTLLTTFVEQNLPAGNGHQSPAMP